MWPFSLLFGDSTSRTKESRVGLRNTGNTCFLNAVLQTLASSSSLLRLLEAQDGSLSYELLVVLKAVKGEGVCKGTPSPERIVKELSKHERWIAFGGQEDADEALTLILSILDKEREVWLDTQGFSVQEERLLRPSMYFHSQAGILMGDTSSSPSRADNPFECRVGTTKVCTRCRQTSDRLLTNTPTLALPVVGHTTLSQCLNAYLATEDLDDIFCDHCTASVVRAAYEQLGRDARSPELVNLGVTGGTDSYLHEEFYESAQCKILLQKSGLSRVACPATRVIQLLSLPTSLILKLQRETFDSWSGTTRKLTHTVTYPSQLGFLYREGGGYCQCESISMANVVYRLDAVVKHLSVKGNANQGHYVCIVRDTHDDGWHAVSDHNVWVVPGPVDNGDTVLLLFNQVDGETVEKNVDV